MKPAAASRTAEATARANPSAAAPSAPTAEKPGTNAPVAVGWQHLLADWLAAHKTYPEAARRRGIEGEVVLRFTVDRSGRVLDVEVVRGAGSPTLDTAAETMLRDAVLPPFTAAMAQDKATVTIQIRYALTN